MKIRNFFWPDTGYRKSLDIRQINVYPALEIRLISGIWIVLISGIRLDIENGPTLIYCI